MDINLEIADISADEMQALATFIARIGHLEYAQNSSNNAEAQRMAVAVDKLYEAIHRAGYGAE
jgi:hypothetical protein